MDAKDNLKTVIKKVTEYINGVEWFGVRFIPRGSKDPLPPIPDEIEFTEEDVDRAVGKFDKMFPDYAGMLEAEPFKKQEYDDAENP